MRYFLFGRVGAGKTFVGQLLAREFGIPYHDGDDDLPESIRNAVRNHQLFTAEMRAEVANVLTIKLHDLDRRQERFCISQALFRNLDRARLRKTFPELIWVWVTANADRIEARLRLRSDGLADLAFARSNNPYFEAPDFPHHVIENEADADAVLAQFAAMRIMLPARLSSAAIG